MKYVTAGEACRHFQVTYITLKRWRDLGILQAKVYGKRKILYDIDSLENKVPVDSRLNVIYARVSTTNQKTLLDNQISLIKQYMLSNGIKPDKVYAEIASGLNDTSRTELQNLIKDIIDNKIQRVYISYKDRLTRFGFGYFKSIADMCNTEIVILDELENTDKDALQELVEDLISIIHHYSTKLYSSRRKQMKEIQKLLSDKNCDDK